MDLVRKVFEGLKKPFPGVDEKEAANETGRETKDEQAAKSLNEVQLAQFFGCKSIARDYHKVLHNLSEVSKRL